MRSALCNFQVLSKHFFCFLGNEGSVKNTSLFFCVSQFSLLKNCPSYVWYATVKSAVIPDKPIL